MINAINGKPQTATTLQTDIMLLDNKWLIGNQIAEEINNFLLILVVELILILI